MLDACGMVLRVGFWPLQLDTEQRRSIKWLGRQGQASRKSHQWIGDVQFIFEGREAVVEHAASYWGFRVYSVAKDLSANSTGGSLQLLSIEAEDGRVEVNFSVDMTATIAIVVLEGLPIIARVRVCVCVCCTGDDKMRQKKGLHLLSLMLGRALVTFFGAVDWC